jgi:hypothetical protein
MSERVYSERGKVRGRLTVLPFPTKLIIFEPFIIIIGVILYQRAIN